MHVYVRKCKMLFGPGSTVKRRWKMTWNVSSVALNPSHWYYKLLVSAHNGIAVTEAQVSAW